MKIIKELADMIDDEIEGARHYVKKALAYKVDHRDLADTLYSLSLEEMGHITRLHEEVTRLIELERQNNGEPPATMMAIYEYVHGKHMDRVKEITEYQSLYRET